MKEYTLYKERQKLINKLPLDAPLGVHICPSTFCNFKCFYCAHSVDVVDSGTGVVGKTGWLKRSFMEMDLFINIIEQLKEFGGTIDTLNFAWLGEPLMHPNIADMVRIAKEANIAHTVSIVTNGSLLTKELSDKLISAGLDRLRISLQGINASDYLSISQYKLNYDDFMGNIDYFYKNKKNTQVYIKIMDEMLKSEDDENRYKMYFSDKCDVLNVEHLIPINNIEGVLNEQSTFDYGYYGNSVKETKLCSHPFYMLIISPTGDILPCDCPSMEKETNMVMTNVNNETIKQYWEGEKLRELRMRMIEGKKDECEICKKCNIPKYHTADEDRLDEYLDILKTKYL